MLQTFMWSSSDWVEDMIMVGSVIIDKAGMNDQSAAGYNDEQAATTEYSAEQAGMNDPKPAK